MRALGLALIVFGIVAFLVSCTPPQRGGYCPPARCILTETIPPSTAAPEQVQP